MVTENAPTVTGTGATQNVGDLFELVAKVEEQETGVFDAPLNRKVATTLAEAGYTLNPGTGVKTSVNELFDILITVEYQSKGVFRATLARTTAKALVEAGCSR
jgi:hypothetical protein